MQNQSLDYLLVETSGVADAEPLAAALSAQGFRLEVVVAVVDAEAGSQALTHEVAQAQVRCADVVIINKCDLADLGATADVENEVMRLSPGVRMLRARYGQVPLPSLLDVEVESSGASSTPAQPDPDKIRGEVAFLSHEAALSQGPSYKVTGRLGMAPRANKPPRLAQRQQQPLIVLPTMHAEDPRPPHPEYPSLSQSHAHDPQGQGHSHDHPQGQGSAHDHPQGQRADRSHDAMHDGFHTVSAQTDRPISLLDLQAFAVQLVTCPGLYRAKGILWLSENRLHRYHLQVSGRQRITCTQGDVFQGPPHAQLVLIGSDPAALHALRDTFVRHSGVTPHDPSPQGPGHTDRGNTGEGASDGWSQPRAVQAAQMVRQALPLQHDRLEAVAVREQEGAPELGKGWQGVAASSAAAVVEFSVRGEPLHGVRGSEVNVSIARRANAALLKTGLLVCGVPEPPAISATGSTSHGSGERMARLQFVVPMPRDRDHTSGMGQARATAPGVDAGPVPQEKDNSVSSGEVQAEAAASSVVQDLMVAAAPVLRTAFPHMGCRCDFVGLMAQGH